MPDRIIRRKDITQKNKKSLAIYVIGSGGNILLRKTKESNMNIKQVKVADIKPYKKERQKARQNTD